MTHNNYIFKKSHNFLGSSDDESLKFINLFK